MKIPLRKTSVFWIQVIGKKKATKEVICLNMINKLIHIINIDQRNYHESKNNNNHIIKRDSAGRISTYKYR